MSGVVAAGQRGTAACALEILRAGGNAVDAAIAGALATFAVEPLLSSAGGGGILTAAVPGHAPRVIEFFGDVPGRGKGEATNLDFVGLDIDFGTVVQEFHVGRGAAVVPSALQGLALAHAQLGTLPLPDLVAPAQRCARDGVRVDEATAYTFRILWPILEREPELVAALSAGRCPDVGDYIANPDLAVLLGEFGRLGHAPDRFWEGLIDGFGPARGGQISEADVRAYEPRVCEPLDIELGAWTLSTSPLVGGHLVEAILGNLAKGTPAANEADEVVRYARASQRGYEARQRLITPGSTTHVSVVDDRGGACAITLTNGEGCGHIIPGTGVHVNNFLGEEDLHPHGFHRHPVGARLPTMVAPTVGTRDGRPVLALGSGGSNRIRTAVGQVLYRLVVGERSLSHAVLAPRVHAERGEVWVELEGLDDPHAAVAALEAEFDQVNVFSERAFFFGGVHAVEIPTEGAPVGIGDPRRGGAALVLE